MRVLITGATGLIGKEIVELCLNEDITVHYLTTSKSKIKTETNYKGFYWNPDKNEIDINCFDEVDTIINLVGASISKRWTDAYKAEVLKSRIQTTKLLAKAIETHNFPIKQIVSASAIGIYPSSLTNYYEEDYSECSKSFLGDVVQQWETVIDTFHNLGILVCKIRIGLVLAKHGGALPKIIKPIKYGLGAAFGSGKQWQSWIHVKDLARMFLFALTEDIEGTYNGVASNPVSNTELTKTAARVLKRPLLLPNIPKFIMRLVLGEMHMLLFESQRVSSAKIEGKGFQFKFSNIEPALRNLLK